MKKLTVFLLSLSLLLSGCGLASSKQSSPELLLSVEADSCRLENAQGQQLSWDGENFQGDLPYQLVNQAPDHWEISTPHSSQLSAAFTGNQCKLVARYDGDSELCFQGSGISSGTLEPSSAITISGADMDFTLSATRLDRMGPGLFRVSSRSKETAALSFTEKGFLLSGCHTAVNLTITGGDHPMTEWIEIGNLPVDFDLSRLSEGIVTVTQGSEALTLPQ